MGKRTLQTLTLNPEPPTSEHLMKIKKVLSSHRYDFTAIMECEHCACEQHLSTGYDDANYHQNVIPSMTCQSCGKNRAGEQKEPNTNGFVSI